MAESGSDSPLPDLSFRGGTWGALLPFLVFLIGVAWLGLSGAPDERGFWPILFIAMGLGFTTSRDAGAYAEAILRGMSQPIVLLMVMAWLLAGILGSLVGASGLVESLAGAARTGGIEGGGFVVAAFLISAVVATSTGTSLGTLLVCAPLLYPVGGPLGSDPTILIGAILGGATFGDNVSPISDTTIASAATQEAEMGGVVRSRMVYALPAAAVALLVAVVFGGAGSGSHSTALESSPFDPSGLVGALGPAVAILLLLKRRHLLEALMAGILATAVAGLALRRFGPADLISIDQEAFLATGLLLQGMERAVGISIFTLLLMGLVSGVEASGVVRKVTNWFGKRSKSRRATEWSIFGAVTAAVILTTHSVVAILTVGPFAKEAGEKAEVSPYRRANLLDVTVCTYPFLLPFFIPTILAASQTSAGAAFGMPRISPLEAGLANAHSWGLLAMILGSILFSRGPKTQAHP